MRKKDSAAHNLIRTDDAEIPSLLCNMCGENDHRNRWRGGRKIMLRKITLALALVIAALALAAVPASAGPNDGAQFPSSSSDSVASSGGGGGGGNLVPLW